MFATFIVLPSGVSFTTSDLSLTSDLNHAFYHSHLHAAQLAANQGLVFQVMRKDQFGTSVSSFGSTAPFTRTSVLYQIMQKGLASVWNFQSEAWIPLNINEEQSETTLQLEKL